MPNETDIPEFQYALFFTQFMWKLHIPVIEFNLHENDLYNI